MEVPLAYNDGSYEISVGNLYFYATENLVQT